MLFFENSNNKFSQEKTVRSESHSSHESPHYKKGRSKCREKHKKPKEPPYKSYWLECIDAITRKLDMAFAADEKSQKKKLTIRGGKHSVFFKPTIVSIQDSPGYYESFSWYDKDLSAKPYEKVRADEDLPSEFPGALFEMTKMCQNLEKDLAQFRKNSELDLGLNVVRKGQTAIKHKQYIEKICQFTKDHLELDYPAEVIDTFFGNIEDESENWAEFADDKYFIDMATEIEDIEICFPGVDGGVVVNLRWLTKEEQNFNVEAALVALTTEIILTEKEKRAHLQNCDDQECAKGKGGKKHNKKKQKKKAEPKLSKQPSEDGQKTPVPVVKELCIIGKIALEGYNEFNLKWWLDHILAIYEPGKFYS